VKEKLELLLVRITQVKNAEVVLLLKQLAALIASGLPLVPCLVTLIEQTTNRKLRYTLSKIKEDVEQGKPLSEAMDKFPRVFPLTVRNTVKVGEASGLLEGAMEQVAGFMEEDASFRGEIITALIYPAIVFTATLAVTGFMVLVVIPQIIPFLEMMGGEMPWNTRLLVDVTNWATENAVTGAYVLGAAVLIFVVAGRTSRGRYMLDSLKTKLPLFGQLISYAIIVQFAKTMHLLITSGVTITEALKTVRDVDKNAVVRRAIDVCIGSVLLGESLSEAMGKFKPVFPPLVRSLTRVGEETGTMDAAMKRIGDIHYTILKSYIKKLNAALEPVLLIFLGGMVGFVAAAMIGGILASYEM
jgi:type IV pilus assembly protein PilC